MAYNQIKSLVGPGFSPGLEMSPLRKLESVLPVKAGGCRRLGVGWGMEKSRR